jgi:hypothetical protein
MTTEGGLVKIEQVWRAVAVAVVMMTPSVLAQERGTVEVTAARANIRAEASETSKVLAQVTKGMSLELEGVEGDWFHVRVPVGSLRVEAYISKKVAKLGPPPSPAAPMAAPTAARPADSAAAERDSMSVVLTNGTASTVLTPRSVRVMALPVKIDSLAKAAPVVPATGSAMGREGDASPATFVWVTGGTGADRVITDRRPVFLANFKDIPGITADDLAPVVVRLSPTASAVRLVAALKGRADEAVRTEADWDVVHDLKQDVVKADVQKVERGTMRITPSADLAPGEYAVVLRLAAKRKLAGSTLLGSEAEGKVFAVCWDFAVK